MGILHYTNTQYKWLSDTVKVEKALERELARSLPRDTQERLTSHCWKESPSQLSEDWQEEVVLRESPSSSTTTPGTSLRASWVVSSEMLLPTLSMPRGRLSLLWMLSMLLRDKAEPFMVSVPN